MVVPTLLLVIGIPIVLVILLIAVYQAGRKRTAAGQTPPGSQAVREEAHPQAGTLNSYANRNGDGLHKNGNGNGHSPSERVEGVRVNLAPHQLIVTGASGLAHEALREVDERLTARERRFVSGIRNGNLHDMMVNGQTDPEGLLRHLQDFGEWNPQGARAVHDLLLGTVFYWRRRPDSPFEGFVLEVLPLETAHARARDREGGGKKLVPDVGSPSDPGVET